MSEQTQTETTTLRFIVTQDNGHEIAAKINELFEQGQTSLGVFKVASPWSRPPSTVCQNGTVEVSIHAKQSNKYRSLWYKIGSVVTIHHTTN